ncbi:helix-turn-helix domain-containing protein [Thalassolituus sp.]|uniref:helix-turn-helix domain-containing protein n=1 Tax=Thalassolituus sp. TaxID=2030822 RepID=UPI003514B123
MTIGARLKAERERLGLTQPAIAKVAGTTKKSQIDYEKGTTSPKADYLLAVSQAGVDLMYVLTGKRSDVVSQSADRSQPTIRITDKEILRQLTNLGNTLGVTPDEALSVVRETAAHYGLGFSETIEALENKHSAGMPRVLASLSRDDNLTNDERELLELYRAAPLKLKMQVVNALSSGHMPQDSGVSVRGNNNQTAGRDAYK